MPQMRATMSGTSSYRRPTRNASKKRGGSKMRSCTSRISPLRTVTRNAPSPSTRAIMSTRIVRSPFRCSGVGSIHTSPFAHDGRDRRNAHRADPARLGVSLVPRDPGGPAFPFISEWLDIAVDPPETSYNFDGNELQSVVESPRQGRRVRRKAGSSGPAFGRSEAAVTVSSHARADRAAARARDRSQTGDALCHHHADDPSALTLQTHAVRRQARLNPGQKVDEHREQLAFVDRATPQLKVYAHVFGDGRGGRQARDVVRARIDGPLEGVRIRPVAQGLNPAGRRTGADRDQRPTLLADPRDPAYILRCRDRPFDQADVIGSFLHPA